MIKSIAQLAYTGSYAQFKAAATELAGDLPTIIDDEQPLKDIEKAVARMSKLIEAFDQFSVCHADLIDSNSVKLMRGAE